MKAAIKNIGIGILGPEVALRTSEHEKVTFDHPLALSSIKFIEIMGKIVLLIFLLVFINQNLCKRIDYEFIKSSISSSLNIFFNTICGTNNLP